MSNIQKRINKIKKLDGVIDCTFDGCYHVLTELDPLKRKLLDDKIRSMTPNFKFFSKHDDDLLKEIKITGSCGQVDYIDKDELLDYFDEETVVRFLRCGG